MPADPVRARTLAGAAFLLLAGLLAGCGPRAGRKESGTPAAAGALRFTDVAARAGLQFTPDRTLKPPLDILQTAGYGGGFLDYDGDGRLDILLVGNPRCALFRNLGEGTFRDVSAAAGLDLSGHWMGCASADWDNDGRADLLLTGYGTAALLRNEGGRFRRVPLAFPRGDWGTSAAFLDYDRDGWLDLYIGCYVRFGPGALRLCRFSGVETACPPNQYDAQAGHLYRNEGGRRFVERTREAGLHRTHGKTLGVAACDYDGDGRQDLYLANDGMPGDLFRNTGGRFVNLGLESGTAFSREGDEQAGMGVDWGDPDGDGRPDLVVTTFQHEATSLYMSDPTQRVPGVFREEAFPRGLGDATVERLGFGVRFFDADNDGDQDLVIANGHVQDAIGRIQPGVSYPQPAQLFEGESGQFREDTAPATADLRRPIVGRAVAAGDYDRDGLVDLLVTNLEGTPLLLHNESRVRSGRPHHWLSLKLEGRPGCRDGSGSVVTAQAGNRTLTRYAGTGGSYLSTSDPRVHLGLGAAASVETLTVRWPNGKTRVWRNLPVDREITLSQE